jgi:hypothetical protein
VRGLLPHALAVLERLLSASSGLKTSQKKRLLEVEHTELIRVQERLDVIKWVMCPFTLI